MNEPTDFLQAALSSVYLIAITIAGYFGWLIIKIFKAITPSACRVVSEMSTRWIVSTVTPAVREIVDSVVGKRLDEVERDIRTIKRATHGSKGNEASVLARVVEVSEGVEKTSEKTEMILQEILRITKNIQDYAQKDKS